MLHPHHIFSLSILTLDAMENWGLSIYRDTFLLVDEKNTCSRQRQLVAAIVGHELAHQWFGNLVTMVGLNSC